MLDCFPLDLEIWGSYDLFLLEFPLGRFVSEIADKVGDFFE